MCIILFLQTQLDETCDKLSISEKLTADLKLQLTNVKKDLALMKAHKEKLELQLAKEKKLRQQDVEKLNTEVKTRKTTLYSLYYDAPPSCIPSI